MPSAPAAYMPEADPRSRSCSVVNERLLVTRCRLPVEGAIALRLVDQTSVRSSMLSGEPFGRWIALSSNSTTPAGVR